MFGNLCSIAILLMQANSFVRACLVDECENALSTRALNAAALYGNRSQESAGMYVGVDEGLWYMAVWVPKVPKANQRPTFPFILWDGIQPPNFVIDVLRYGPTFAPPPPKNRTRDLIPDIEYLVKSLTDTQKEYYRCISSINIMKAKEQQEIIELRDKLNCTTRWMRKNGVILTRADKSRTLVLMKRNSYQQSLREYIDNTMCKKEKDDIIDRLQAKVRRLADSKLARRLALCDIVVDSPDVPRLFAYAKTHKTGQQLRPIVDKVRAPTRKLEKAIHNLLTPHLENYPYNVNKPTDLIRLLQDLPSPPQFMTVLDFKSMYPSIELPPTFCSLRDFLFNTVQDQALYQQVLEVAHLACYDSVFKFSDTIYRQKKGVPMGSPLSGNLCEMVVRQLETKALPPFLPSILVYKRYVDNILIIWKEIPDMTSFVRTVNNNPFGLTVELEQAGTEEVHFLDIRIKVVGPTIQTAVYHKPSPTPTYIPANSCDPFPYKAAAFRALVERAFSHSSTKQALTNELARIKKIATEHRFPNMTHRLIEQYQRRKHTLTAEITANPQRNNPARIPITYNLHLKTVHRKIAKEHGIRLAYRRCPTIFRILRNDKDPPDCTRLPGIYSIPLRDNRQNAELLYNGLTKRSLNTRLREHQADIRHGRLTTALATYASNPEIEVHFERATIIVNTPHQQQLRWLEAAAIHNADRLTFE
ncbi:uncharacterized protein LOC111616874 [Centruroides sculpturatus]|uniref:uncharacterized protein LOC111616874 n=1 Tax=Centruroides sculpturatus TaxID=218467 RepID=UPI000C6EAEB3|nr:uncharacterized protein LOC111616874 [Centruroides sculpturatus]